MRRSVALVASLMIASPIQAQVAEPSSSPGASGFVAGLGLGGGSLGLAGKAYAGAATSRGVFLARVAGTTDLDLNRSVNDTSSDVAVLYGRASDASTGIWVRGAVGPALVRTVRGGPRRMETTDDTFRSYTEREESTTAGLAFQLDIAWGRRPGVGLGLVGNLNGDGSFAMAVLTVHSISPG